ncbi:MAG: type II toxin-antitoxin system YafQ family toxin [Prevotellaceae bacterium]|jgi:mRNA interferase YafQ|nr:type II toxin-antitoxin system YafQ family toxin [Prevotellaceae bacterium]
MPKKQENKKLTAMDFFAKIKSLQGSESIVFELQVTNQFKKSIDLSYYRNFDLNLLFDVIALLAQDKPLPEKNHAHKLKGNYAEVWECHIKPDWLLMWQEERGKLVLLLLSTITHSDFTGKKRK